jgi:hypothetical protein
VGEDAANIIMPTMIKRAPRLPSMMMGTVRPELPPPFEPLGVGIAVPVGEGDRLGEGDGLGDGDGLGEGEGVGDGLGDDCGVGVGVGALTVNVPSFLTVGFLVKKTTTE